MDHVHDIPQISIFLFYSRYDLKQLKTILQFFMSNKQPNNNRAFLLQLYWLKLIHINTAADFHNVNKMYVK